jgi:hypothetical protein
MLLIGLSFLLYWLLLSVFTVELIKATLIMAIVLILLGLVVEGAPSFKQFPWKRP